MSKFIIPSLKSTLSREDLNTVKNYIIKQPNQYFPILQKSIKEGNNDNINLLLSLPNISFKNIHPAKKSYNIFHFLSENNTPTELFFFVEQQLKKQKVNIHNFLNQTDDKGNTSFVLLMAQKELNLKTLSFIADRLPHQEIKDTQSQLLIDSFCELLKWGKYDITFIHEATSILDSIDFKITREIINVSANFGYINSILINLYDMEGVGLKFISEMLQVSNDYAINQTLKPIMDFLFTFNITHKYVGSTHIEKAIQNNEVAFKKLITPYLKTSGFAYSSLIKGTIGKSYFEDFLHEPEILDAIKQNPVLLKEVFCDHELNAYIFSHLYDLKNEAAFLFKNTNTLIDLIPHEYIKNISSKGEDNFLQWWEITRTVSGLEPLFSLFLAKGIKYSNSLLNSDDHSFIPLFFCTDYTNIPAEYMNFLPSDILNNFETVENNKFKLKNEIFRENVLHLETAAFTSIIKCKEFEENSLFNELLFNQLKDNFLHFEEIYDIYSQEGLEKLFNELVLNEQQNLIQRNYGEEYAYQNSYKNILSIYRELKENHNVDNQILINIAIDFFHNIAKEDFFIKHSHQQLKNEIQNKLKIEFAEMERNSIRKNIYSDNQKLTINKKRM